MKRFIEGESRTQTTLLPGCLDDYIAEDNRVRAVEAFIDELDLLVPGFAGMKPAATGRPSCHPSVLLKLYVYGYLNRIQSSRRLERECQRNVELLWLTGKLSPDFKTIADFRRDNGEAIRNVCREFIVLCRRLNLFTQAMVAIDGSKFKAVNAHDRNFTRAKLEKRIQQIDQCIGRYLAAMDASELNAIADRGYFNGDEILACDKAGIIPCVSKPMTSSAKAEGRFDKEDFVYDPAADEYKCPAGSRLSWRFASVEAGQLINRYWSSDCPRRPIKNKCTPGDNRRVRRWEHEANLEAMQRRLDLMP